MREAAGEGLGGLGVQATAVEFEVPRDEIGFRQKALERRLFADQLPVEVARVPVVEDVADIEDDGGDRRAQPWRALKRRLVLLMT